MEKMTENVLDNVYTAKICSSYKCKTNVQNDFNKWKIKKYFSLCDAMMAAM